MGSCSEREARLVSSLRVCKCTGSKGGENLGFTNAQGARLIGSLRVFTSTGARLVSTLRVYKSTASKAGPAYLVASKGVDMHQGG